MRKLRMGMIGGGEHSFIGNVHRMAARLDGHIELVCGSFSRDYDNSLRTGKKLHLDLKRIYKSYEEMIRQEAELNKDERMEFVSIVTPNHVHFEPAKLAMQHGFDVICDKPLCLTLEEAKELSKIQKETQRIFGLTHTYAGYPMIQELKHLIENVSFGKVRRVSAKYFQGWLSDSIELSGQKQASWRTDKKSSGIGGAIGDIGTHAHHLIEYCSGLNVYSLLADLSYIGKDRQLDDDANILLRLENGVKGELTISQVASGVENDLELTIVCERATLIWKHSNCNQLTIKSNEHPYKILRRGMVGLSTFAQAYTRLPSGHPEGFIEAFANLYTSFAKQVYAKKGVSNEESYPTIPSLEDGVRGMAFIQAAVHSHQDNNTWKEQRV